MAIQTPGTLISLPAAADFSSIGQYRFCKIDANGRAALTAAATDVATGVIQDDVANVDDAAQVMLDSMSKIVLGAVLAPGALVTSDANGAAVAAAAGNQVYGTILVGGALGEIGTIILTSTQL